MLEHLIRVLLARVLPGRVARDIADDLFEEYHRIRHTRGAAAAAWLLIREVGSLAGAATRSAAGELLRARAIVRRDFTHAMRAVVRRRWSSVGAVLMIAGGLAATAAALGLAASLLLRPISSRYPDTVFRLASSDRAGVTRLAFSAVELDHVREQLAGTATVAVANLQPVVLRIDNTDTQTLAEVVGGPYFDTIGLAVPLGRPIVEADAAPGASPVVVISEALWRQRFRGDPEVLGATLRLNGRAFTVAGVTAGAGTSTFLGGSVDAWIAVAHADAMLDRSWRTNPDNRWWTTLVHQGADAAGAVGVALDRAAAEMARRWPDAWRERQLRTLPGTILTGRQRDVAVTLSIVLIAFAALILAAAGANVSGLLLAAAAAGRGRAAIQLAVGSGRGALLARHLYEGAILGAAAGAVAVAIYALLRRELADVTLLPTLALRLDLPLSTQIAGLILGAGILTGLLLSIGPALWLTRLDVAGTLRDGAGRGSASLSRARRLLVAAQVAISLMLLTGAALFARSAGTLDALDVGFPRHGLIAFDFDLEPSAPAPGRLPELAREALDRVSTVPGVIAAAMSNRAPIDSSTPAVSVSRPGSTGPPLSDVTFYLATEGYFDTVGLPIAGGRAFTAEEAARDADVAIVNEDLAGRMWPDGDALDRPLLLHPQQRVVRVIGVARDSKYRSLTEPSRPHLYLPAAPNFSRSLLVRTQGDERQTILAVQAVLDQVGPGVVGFFPRTLADHLAIDMLPTRASARAASLLAAIALLLSAAGLYGIVMWFVEVRRREIGIRVALGASTRDVRLMVVRQAASAAAPGAIVGLAAAVGLTVLGQSLFVGVGAIDPASLGLGMVVLGAIVLAASYRPASRASQVDPAIALRE